METEEPTGFLSRWSRRKRGEEVPEPEAPPPAKMPVAEVPETAAPQVLAPQVLAPQILPPQTLAEPEFDLASLPPIETLDASSDYTLFFKPGVPQALRTAALRKAWIADPLIRDYMSPLDYAWDFNTPGGLPHGFSNVLAETGEALRKLINQAIGEMEPEEEKPEVAPEVMLAEAAPAVDAEAPEAVAAPEAPLRLSESLPPIPAAPEEVPEPARPRRHGGAVPV